jgi:hypothetical protein
MWISFQCVIPPLLPETELSLIAPGIALSASFDAPVDKGYPLIQAFDFPSKEAKEDDKVVGTRYCPFDTAEAENIPSAYQGPEYGQPIPIRILISRKSEPTPILDKTFHTLCRWRAGGPIRKQCLAGYIGLPRGKYSIQIHGVKPLPELIGVTTKIVLAGGLEK